MNNFPNITEEWLNTPNNLLGEKLLAGYTDPKSIQERLLTEILQSASHCEIGKKFDFNSIHTIQEFQQRMPLTDWYDTKSAKVVGFQHRTVQGGLFMKILMDKSKK